ncbi:MAG: porin family protein [Syntrophales bacterium]
MKKSFYTGLFALILIFVAAIPVGAFEIGARALYWFPSLDGEVKADNAGVVGTRLDLKDDLGVDNESFPSVEVFGGIGKHTISLAYTPIDYSGSKTLTTPINFNGKTFGATVDTDLELKMLDFQYRYRFLDVENVLAGFSLSAVGQIKYIDGLASIRDTATASKAEYTINVPVPMIGAGAHAGILAGLLEARAQLTGAFYSGNYLLEGLADLSLTPFPFVAINAGYKILHIKIDHNDVFLDSTFSGPYVGMTVSF